MAAKPLPSLKLLRQLLDYDPSTGEIIWRARTPDMFHAAEVTPEAACNRWNSRCAGRAAGYVNGSGYVIFRVGALTYPAHRIAWYMYYGCEPKFEIDHIDGDKTNNRIENLRDVTPTQNGQNKRLLRNNTSGVVGVHWHQKGQKWTAKIKYNRRDIYLGLFARLEDAIAARRAAERQYGFHQNHGKR